MNNIHIPIITCLVILALAACNKEKETEHDYPCVDTGQVTDINANGVTFNGSFRQSGSGEIIDHGFAFSEDVLPSLHNEYISLGTSTGSGRFSAKATYAMKAGKTYYVCAYARNKGKTYFGQVNSFISAGSYPPEIYEVIPAQGIKSDTVTIKGANMGRFNNKVLFGNQGAGIISASNSEIVVQVPSSKGQSQVDISITVAG